MTQTGDTQTNNIVSAPKSIHDMKKIIQPVMLDNRDLTMQMHELVGFQISWKLLTVTQAAMVWLAWNAVHGDEPARQMLALMRGVQVEEREQVSPQEVATLRQIQELFRKLERVIYTAHNPVFAYVDPESALYDIVTERNEAMAALSECKAQKKEECHE